MSNRGAGCLWEGYHNSSATYESTHLRRSFSSALPITRLRFRYRRAQHRTILQPNILRSSSKHWLHTHGALRYGIAHPLRSVPRLGVTKDNGLAWSSACAYIASHLLVKELSLNIDFAIPQDFQRFRWVVDLTQICGLRRIFHHNSPNKHALKAEETPYVPRNQMSRNDWGTDEYRWEALLGYLRPKMLL